MNASSSALTPSLPSLCVTPTVICFRWMKRMQHRLFQKPAGDDEGRLFSTVAPKLKMNVSSFGWSLRYLRTKRRHMIKPMCKGSLYGDAQVTGPMWRKGPWCRSPIEQMFWMLQPLHWQVVSRVGGFSFRVLTKLPLCREEEKTDLLGGEKIIHTNESNAPLHTFQRKNNL